MAAAAVGRKSKIVCTLGPSCWDTDTLIQMIDAGMGVARLNFSHGSHEAHGNTLANLRAALAERPQAQVMRDIYVTTHQILFCFNFRWL